MEKDDFAQYRSRAMLVEQLRAQLMTLESSMYSPRVQRYSAAPVSSSVKGSAMEDTVASHIDLEARYRRELATKEAQQLAVERAIQSLEDPEEQLVMRARYIEGLSWRQVASKLSQVGLGERTIHRRHMAALRKLKGERFHE